MFHSIIYGIPDEFTKMEHIVGVKKMVLEEKREMTAYEMFALKGLFHLSADSPTVASSGLAGKLRDLQDGFKATPLSGELFPVLISRTRFIQP